MDMLTERIEIMYESGQMDKVTYEQLPQILQTIEKQLGIELVEDNAGPFTGHLIKAIERVKNNEALQEGSEVLIQDAKASKELYDFAVALLSPYNGHGAPLEVEASFITSYLIAMTSEEEM